MYIILLTNITLLIRKIHKLFRNKFQNEIHNRRIIWRPQFYSTFYLPQLISHAIPHRCQFIMYCSNFSAIPSPPAKWTHGTRDLLKHHWFHLENFWSRCRFGSWCWYYHPWLLGLVRLMVPVILTTYQMIYDHIHIYIQHKICVWFMA